MRHEDNGILIISTNREQFPCPVVPVGALQVDAELRRYGEETSFIDLCFANEIDQLILEKLTNFKPNIIIISIRNIDNETFLKPKFYLEEVKTIIEFCRLHSISKIILGGIGFTTNYQEIFHYLNADYGIIESNFESFHLLIQCIKQGNDRIEDLKQIKGLIFWENGQIKTNIISQENMSSIKIDWNHILQNCDPNYYSFKRDIPHPPLFGLRTKSGCIFKCIHCQIPKIEGDSIQYIPIDETIDTLKLMERKYEIKRIYIVDNVFNYPYEQALNLCREICNQNINIKWTCYLHPKFVDHDLIKMMVKAGCENVQFGIDTASDKLLNKWGKGFTSTDLICAAQICRDENLRCFYSLIFGGWEETPETIEESLETLKEAKARFIWGTYGVRIHPNTEMADLAYKNGVLDKKDNLLHPRFYLSPQIKKIGLEVINRFKENNPEIIVKVNTGEG
jgi:radical SAM superfamily enzyme YgiQ (UPF0313 family)